MDIKMDKISSICRFCLKPINIEDFVTLEDVKDVAEKCVPEMDAYLMDDCRICQSCWECLKEYCNFVRTCLQVEEIISAYLKNTAACKVYLSEIVHFMVMVEPVKCRVKEDRIEINTDNRFEQRQKWPLTTDTPLECQIHRSKRKKHMDKQAESQKNLVEKIPIFRCELCSYEGKNKKNLNTHLFTHRKDVPVFKCESCNYETIHKSRIKSHVLTHKNPEEIAMFSCELCSYAGKWKWSLNLHMLTHKAPEEITMFKCELCSYETKQKVNLKKHIVTHKDPVEITMFRCDFCCYEGKLKGYLKKHMLTHKSPQEISMFRCELCSYEAKWKYQLRRHLSTHKNPEEITLFKCELCDYKAKQKRSIKKHMLTHENKQI